MTLANFPQLKRLSPRQRLKIAEELWDSAASDAMPVPDSHKKLIRSRRAAYEKGEIPTITMSELAKAIRGIAEGIASMKLGEGQPAKSVFARLRKKHRFKKK